MSAPCVFDPHFDMPGIYWQARAADASMLETSPVVVRATVDIAEKDTPGYAYIEPKARVGPRGGDDRFRAAAKAARKARKKHRHRKG